MMPLTVPDLAINADGTSYQTSGGLTDKVQVLYDPLERVEKREPLKVMAVKGSTLTAFLSSSTRASQLWVSQLLLFT